MNNLPHNNLDLFYFTEHNSQQSLNDTIGDIENEINIDTQLKYVHSDNIDVTFNIIIYLVKNKKIF
jgi:hypothetical protein